ncbi:hypothetical protein DM860_016269 [Cuscuta australis]|uniref:Cystatin domain-containing protein n=1 Tax=Cuscuta australis TaxID=267555 RepID=A0A328E4W7_9ASTE|nr:hypothetical protein DM860_016269 [Cuscuta australis]
MAKNFGLNLFLVMVSLVAMAALANGQVGGGVGGRSPIADAKSNKQVQELAKFCVAEYNKGLKEKKAAAGNGGGPITFSEVVKAEKQVVAGMKYYLRITAKTSGGATKTFDAEVFVKPRATEKELITFAPSKLA